MSVRGSRDAERAGSPPPPSDTGGIAVLSLETVIDTLWPGAQLQLGTIGGATNTLGTFVALPSRASPSVLLPVRSRRVTAAVLRAHRAPRTARQRVSQPVMVAFARLGAARLLPRKLTVSAAPGRSTESIQAHLGEILGRHVVVGVHLGPPRANRKPIVQVVDEAGTTHAFTKVGFDDLTRELVQAEGRALSSLQSHAFSYLTVPRVVHIGQWQGKELLVLAPVGTRNTGAAQPNLLQLAMVELSTSDGCTRRELISSAYWQGLRSRIQALAGPQSRALLEAVATIEGTSAGLEVDLGAWHGDWTPWNMALRDDRAVLWDWERFASGVPVGFDALHFELQSTIRQGQLSPRDAVPHLGRRAGELLAPFGVRGPQTLAVTVTYLLEIGARYLHDQQAEAGSRLGNLDAWLIPGLSALVDDAPLENEA